MLGAGVGDEQSSVLTFAISPRPPGRRLSLRRFRHPTAIQSFVSLETLPSFAPKPPFLLYAAGKKKMIKETQHFPDEKRKRKEILLAGSIDAHCRELPETPVRLLSLAPLSEKQNNSGAL